MYYSLTISFIHFPLNLLVLDKWRKDWDHQTLEYGIFHVKTYFRRYSTVLRKFHLLAEYENWM